MYNGKGSTLCLTKPWNVCTVSGRS